MTPVLVEKSHGWFRSWFRKVWQLRGGGLYACGFAVTFIIYEVQSLADDVLGIGALFSDQAITFIINFIIDSFMNTIRAFMWPVNVVQLAPPWGAIGLGIAFFAFAKYLKPPIEQWLFGDEPDLAEEPEA